MKVLISIITPSYNSSKTIEQTIISVLKQSYENWELIIIDDKSTDYSVKIIQKYADLDSRIKLLKNKINSGVAYSRNIGLDHINGNYVCFLDSDDYWDSDKLEVQIKEMLNNNLSILTSSYQEVNLENIFVGNPIEVPDKTTYKSLLKTNSIPCLSVMFESSIANKYRFKKIGHEDYVFWLEVLNDGYTAHGLKKVLAYYRVGNSSLSSNKFKAATFQWNIYRKELGFSILKSVYYFGFYSFFAIKKHII